jgi:hypothetical protein
MRMGQLALMVLVAMAVSGSEIEIEGYQLGWSGGVTGFGRHAVLTPGGIAVVISCPGETKRVGFSARDRLYHGIHLKMRVRPCLEEDPCACFPEEVLGVATVIERSKEQRPEYRRAYETIFEFLESLWRPGGRPPAELFTLRCRSDPASQTAIEWLVRTRWQWKGGPPVELDTFNAWAFAELGENRAAAVLAPHLFHPDTSARIEVVFEGGRSLIDRVSLEPPSSYDRLFGSYDRLLDRLR